jgi:uncharacterized protein (TIGR02265 family)
MPARTSHAVELVAEHCDISDRLRYVPPSASIRGLFFQNVEARLEAAGKLEAYRDYFPDDRYFSLPYYPLSEFLVRLACAGALIRSPPEVHEGIRAITQGNASTFVQSLLGRALVRLMSSDPIRLTEQGIAARRQSHNYGRWTIVRLSPSSLQVVYEDEFQWIESAVVGAAEGTYVACTPTVYLETVLHDRFRGATTLRW